ncbi:hypothetical protein F383_21391 [Gossypium arboreum]|uniref:Uncharacterized protein n=1 Tax=Gossypium arboreum TaxID=29729 RepID=A0A0B0P1Q5_GOSAR|nr:hypothetical protein F383_21391 [Gossypium arboreum]
MNNEKASAQYMNNIKASAQYMLRLNLGLGPAG